MVTLGQRIKSLRKDLKMSQSDLAKRIGISYAQIGRYEIKDAQPPAEVLKKIANTLNTNIDFLIYGSKEEKAKIALKDAEVLKHFKEVELLSDNDKNALLCVIKGFIRDCRTKQAFAS